LGLTVPKSAFVAEPTRMTPERTWDALSSGPGLSLLPDGKFAAGKRRAQVSRPSTPLGETNRSRALVKIYLCPSCASRINHPCSTHVSRLVDAISTTHNRPKTAQLRTKNACNGSVHLAVSFSPGKKRYAARATTCGRRTGGSRAPDPRGTTHNPVNVYCSCRMGPGQLRQCPLWHSRARRRPRRVRV
jgi:hypothetical protein